ncbi:hypothetical protein GCM10027277_37950 [Pseudoduganella ginsengisoli]|uniref:Transporter substrate-binding domain-containing protein n=1 Tax=Pseudoduganella ginsengisoli TaxID=1462440 RepID=A0A6L6Q8L7_9BURK|nr:transporter substrate-binding domain-containing protein [Pseudoduganella ginsengisoli]MTW05965.1 transporter substrate-binding domain-containing protein [Pseudoduganella ginsengisoli]
MRYAWLASIQLAGSVAIAGAQPASISHVAICEDENEWPPYVYRQRAGDGTPGRLTGYAVDVVNEIFTRNGIRSTLELLPWPRCQAVAKLGKQYQMALNLTYNPERQRNFLLTRAYYSTNTYYYYSRRHYPTGLKLNSLTDIHHYRVCGIHGYNYLNYGLTAGEVDQGARDFASLIAKLHAGRCALFLEKHEVMTGFSAIGKDYLADGDLAGERVPGMRPTAFYIGISRNYEYAHELRTLVDDELLRMEENGRLAEIWRKYAR